MKWASTLRSGANAGELVGRGADEVEERLEGARVDLVFAFMTPHYAREFSHLARLLKDRFPRAVVAGCTAGGVIGGGREEEDHPSVSLMAGNLPGVELHPVYTDTEDLPDEDAAPEVWRSWLGMGNHGQAGHAILLADPFTATIEPFVAGFDYAYPAGVRLGGLASGGRRPGDHGLFFQDQVFRQGLVAVGLSGEVEVDAVVAQGCRPLGEPLVVTHSRQNTLFEVNHESPLIYLNRVFQKASEGDRDLMRNSLFLGIQVGEDAPFLIRNVMAANYQQGTLNVGAYLHEGQVVQFHVRDRGSAAEELNQHLGAYAREAPVLEGAGALLFSCLGRGRHLFGEAGHDTGCFRRQVGGLPVGGFFCNGEIGPVGGSTYIHGYTSAFGVIRPALRKGVQ
ncbi:MAG TPA: FIST N-terminal domain-containing protein [Kiritimatiellia bacterium]|nr:FIST N-terminal domain-containing protein [Kiritimatiellia bacterium]